MVVILRLLPLGQGACDDGLTLTRDVARHTQPHGGRQTLGQVGNELVVAIGCLDENLRLALAFDV